ncbi:hypothetical protein [Polaribacter ponticola]|uniref:DUF4249 family protein n=1 Tax=Polaribacter ponticola TaxID=2978475 RepID=A0ABT5SB87_9FLAO|nr:hypothetical protein [Polaribacter sp. MSW5]MDD7915333.1 hypothetical protein [Polaribacter sp. MSW5]
MKLHLVFIGFVIFFLNGCSQVNSIDLEDKYPIIPVPNEISYGNSEIQFESVHIIANDFKNEGNILVNFFNKKI